jgi:aminoglycoside phosphotransferase (APT) family kinase protein
MALKNRIDPGPTASRLGIALERHLEATDAHVSGVQIPEANGMSGETVLFEATWSVDHQPRREQLVARVQPAGPAVFPRYDLELEFAVMNALGERTDLPMPRMLFSEPASDLLGAPFIVMTRIAGRVPPDDPPFTTDGWLLELSPERQRKLYANAVEVLARIHAVEIDAVGLSQLRDHAEAGLDGQLTLWEETFRWAADGDENPTVEAALGWVRDHRPAATSAPVLNWGDARIGNLLFDDDLAVTGVLDWEMTSISPRELDLGWWLFILRYYTEGIGASLPPGFPDRAGFLAQYAELSGVQPAPDDLHFYEVFAGVRLAILMHRAGNLMIEAGLLPADAPMKLSNPASHLVAKLLDLPAPEGVAQSFAGNRS